MTRLLLVDDHASSRELLALMIADEPGITDVFQASSLAEAAPLLDRADVAVIDLGLPDGDGLSLVRDLRRRRPDTRVLVLTASFDPRSAERAISAGAAAVLNKTISLDELRQALRRAGVGTAVEPGVDRSGPRDAPGPLADPRIGAKRLSPREHDVLEALADGLTDKEIGLRLGISTETVRTHMAGLFGKLGVESRLQALAFAVRWGLVRTEPTPRPPRRRW
jgi:DNA-binding NarL/FixJ family response regulator